jgi:hypothetical protein
MLPGFRFLFAATVLSMSILVFGLGATALLRAAHEEFASTPSWHASPEPVFAQPAETTGPVLAMLRVEPPATEEKALEAPDQAPTAAAPAEQPATSTTSAEPEVAAKPADPELTATPVEREATAKPVEPEVTVVPAEPEGTAALPPENSSQPETAKPDTRVAESPAQQEPAPAQTVAPAAADETKMSAAVSEQSSTPASEAAAAAPEPAIPPASSDATIASTKIATLGDPPLSIEAAAPAKPTVAKHNKRVIRKRVEARRKSRHRRRLALRARIVQQLPQQPTDPFGQQFTAERRR